MPESSRPESAPQAASPETPAEAPVRPLPLIPSLQVLDLGGAVGMACDIDDPDCVLPEAPASMTGDEGNA